MYIYTLPCPLMLTESAVVALAAHLMALLSIALRVHGAEFVTSRFLLYD